MGLILREYETVAEAANSRWSPPQAGILAVIWSMLNGMPNGGR